MLLIGRGREPVIFHVIFIPDKIYEAEEGILLCISLNVALPFMGKLCSVLKYL